VIMELKNRVSVLFLCNHFGVSKAGLYSWLKRIEFKSLSVIKKEKVCDQIKEIFKKSYHTYGSPRVYEELKSLGFDVSVNTVAKYMRELELDARLKKKFRVATTDSNHKSPIAPRLFKTEEEDCLPTEPGVVLAGDITYLRLGKSSFVYLAVVIDLYNREVLGWSMSRSLETKLILDALDMAMKKVGPDAKTIFHSDRGSQYASDAYRNFLKNKQIKPSMSRRGNCYDNCFVESWFKSLKNDFIYRRFYQTEEELRALVFEYIEVFYNKKRRHSALDYLSPVDYKIKQTEA